MPLPGEESLLRTGEIEGTPLGRMKGNINEKREGYAMATEKEILQHQERLKEQLPVTARMPWSSIYKAFIPEMSLDLSSALSTITLLELEPKSEAQLIANIIAGGEDSLGYQWILKYWGKVRDIEFDDSQVKARSARGHRKYRGSLAYRLSAARREMPGELRNGIQLFQDSSDYEMNLHGNGEFSGKGAKMVGVLLMSERDNQLTSDSFNYLEEIHLYLLAEYRDKRLTGKATEVFLSQLSEELNRKQFDPGVAAGEWDPICSMILSNIGWVTRDTLGEFFVLAEQYNLEWAMAGFDWEENARGVDVREELYNFIRESYWGESFMGEFQGGAVDLNDPFNPSNFASIDEMFDAFDEAMERGELDGKLG